MLIRTSIAGVMLIAAASGAVTAKDANRGLAQKVQGAYAAANLPNVDSAGARQYYSGTPTDRLDIWRHGHYLGNDPDSRIRLNLIRDDRGHAY
jgi:hypothetical protein